MKVNVEELSPIERKLSIEVEPAQVSQELDRAYAQLSLQVKLPGFRPGKIPRRMLEQRYRAEVENDVVRRLVTRSYLEAIREHKIDAVADPQVIPPALKVNEPYAFEARVEVKPKLTAQDYRGLPLTKREPKVEDAKVDERLESIRNQLTRLEPVTDRDVAKSGDFATIDYAATVDGKPFPGDKAEDVTVEIAPGELVASKLPAIEGVKVGESKELDYAFPADYQVDEVKGKTGHFKVTVKALKTQVVPELNDEFAKETGGADTLEGLRARIRGDLEKSLRNQQQGEERDQIFKELISRNAFEVPKAMVERAIELMLDGALRMMARSGVDPSQLNLDFGKLREEMRPRAETEVKGTLLLEAIAAQEKIEAGAPDVEKRIEQLAAESNQPVSQVRKQFREGDARRNLALRVREEKTVEFLKASATYS